MESSIFSLKYQEYKIKMTSFNVYCNTITATMQVYRNKKFKGVLFINSDLLFIDSGFSLHRNNNLLNKYKVVLLQ